MGIQQTGGFPIGAWPDLSDSTPRWSNWFFGWLGRCQRLAKDFERTIASALAWLHLAVIRILLRRLGRAETPANSEGDVVLEYWTHSAGARLHWLQPNVSIGIGSA